MLKHWIAGVVCLAVMACGSSSDNSEDENEGGDVCAATGLDFTSGDATAGAELHYTTDGSTPTAASALYSAPFTVTATTVVKVRAFKAGFSDSDVVSATFFNSNSAAGCGFALAR
jgi:hypothetical protein